MRASIEATFAAIRAKLAAEHSPFAVTVHMKIKQGAASSFADALRPAIAFSRQEQGCLAYDLNQSVDQPDTFLLYERWASLNALRTHMASEEYSILLDNVQRLLVNLEFEVHLPYAE